MIGGDPKRVGTNSLRKAGGEILEFIKATTSDQQIAGRWSATPNAVYVKNRENRKREEIAEIMAVIVKINNL